MNSGIPGFRDVNAMHNVDSFVLRWLSGQPLPGASDQIGISQVGNINTGGVLGGKYAPALTPSDQCFWDVIEPSVQPLVKAVIRNGMSVTYTSCEGHDYRSYGLMPSELHVGILPIWPNTATALKSVLDRAAREFKKQAPSSILLVVAPGHLLDEATRRSYSVLDLYLCRSAKCSWDEYFQLRAQWGMVASQVIDDLMGGHID